MKTLRTFLVGTLAAAVAFGGIEVASAVSSNKEIKVCASKSTGSLRYTKRSCTRNETAIVLNTQGVPGAKGDTGATGPKGDTGASGASASAFTALLICGADGTSLCKEGMQGPGGGTIFFVDYHDIYSGFNYLEAAPMGWGNGIAVNQGSISGETTGTTTADPLMKWCNNVSAFVYSGTRSQHMAVGTGSLNTATADVTCSGGAVQAASDYVSTVGSKSDWFLPSEAEAFLMYTNLLSHGAEGFPNSRYWTSTESDVTATDVQTWYTNLGGYQDEAGKVNFMYVRPIRQF